MDKDDLTANIKRRLRKIEGQVKGIERMLDKDSCCMDVLVQISAVRAATSKVGVMILDNYAKECLSETFHEKESKEKLEELMKVITNFIK
ncbi:MAG: metal-sensitive transcriptional regulator [Clostridia bacterium]|nr:metal-sensitive transcriptional regulator [Clostridia bacterium]MDD4047240.1 metal-sensitive transcriptional regulator [Clostridia bacterium]